MACHHACGWWPPVIVVDGHGCGSSGEWTCGGVD